MREPIKITINNVGLTALKDNTTYRLTLSVDKESDAINLYNGICKGVEIQYSHSEKDAEFYIKLHLINNNEYISIPVLLNEINESSKEIMDCIDKHTIETIGVNYIEGRSQISYPKICNTENPCTFPVIYSF